MRRAETLADDDVVVEPAQLLLIEADDETLPRDRWPLLFAVLAGVAALAWIALIVMTQRPPTTLGEVSAAVAFAAPVLVLIALTYMIVVPNSRLQSVRFGNLAAGLRVEQARLEASLLAASARIDAETGEIAAQSDRLMTVGEDAAQRLRAVAETLRRDVDTVVGTSAQVQASTHAARGDIVALLTDLPRAQALTTAMRGAIDAAGMSATERVGALDGQIAALIARSREVEDVAGGATQRLAAHLARVPGLSDAASKQLVDASWTMVTAIDAALARAAEASDAARQAMDAQAQAMRALVEESEAALATTGLEATEALGGRVEDVTARVAALSDAIEAQGEAGRRVTAEIDGGLDRVDARFAVIDEQAHDRNARLAEALSGLGTHADTLAAALERGGGASETLIARAETLMTALEALTRGVEDDLPAAFERLGTVADTSHARVAAIAPDVADVERSAAAALDRLIEAETLLSNHRAAFDALASDAAARLAASTTAASDLVAAVEGADARAHELADGAGAALVEAMVRVREAAQAAADRAREALAAVVPDSAARLSSAVKVALTDAVATQVEVQVTELAATAERAVASANSASDRLMRQMLTIAETSAQVEARIGEARAEIEDADRDNFARRVALLIESLNSTSIDVTKILSNDVTDTAWGAYLKGDRGVFTRRAVRLLDSGEAREVMRHYNDDGDFRDQVNRYVHDFEAMLRNVLATRSGSPLGVTLLSSDMGKLYVALAQAIERLRS